MHTIPSSNHSTESAWCARLLPVARLFALRRVGSADGDDLAQEAIALLVRAIREGTIADEGAAAGYLLAVCRNLVRSHLRKGRRRGALLAREGAVLPTTTDPVEIDHRRLWSCMNLLGAKAREVIVRSYVADETAAEMSPEIGLSPENIRVIRHRALAALHACIEGAP